LVALNHYSKAIRLDPKEVGSNEKNIQPETNKNKPKQKKKTRRYFFRIERWFI